MIVFISSHLMFSLRGVPKCVILCVCACIHICNYIHETAHPHIHIYIYIFLCIFTFAHMSNTIDLSPLATLALAVAMFPRKFTSIFRPSWPGGEGPFSHYCVGHASYLIYFYDGWPHSSCAVLFFSHFLELCIGLVWEL